MSPSSMAEGREMQTEQPESVWQFVIMVLRGIRSNYKRILRTLLFQVIVIVPLLTFLNTYIIAYLNQGVLKMEGINNPTEHWHYFLRLGGNQSAVDALWFLIMYVLFSLYGRISATGLRQFILDLGGTPAWTVRNLTSARRQGVPALLLGMAIALLLTVATRNRLLFVVVSIGILLSYTRRDRNSLLLVLRLIWSDLQRLVRRRRPPTMLSPSMIAICLMGALLGTVILAFLPGQPYSALLLCAVCLALGVLLVLGRIGPRTALAMLGLFVGQGFCSALLKAVSAHDTGWTEGGATLVTWLNSPGAIDLILAGVRPGVAGVAGALSGSTLSGLTSGILASPIGPGTAGAASPAPAAAPASVTSAAAEAALTGAPSAQAAAAAAAPTPAQEPAGASGPDETPASGGSATEAVLGWTPSQAGGPVDNPQVAYDGGRGPGKCGPGLPNYWISTTNLGLVIKDTILAWEGRGPRVVFALSHNMGDRYRGLFGPGWRASYESRIVPGDGVVFLWKGTGQRLTFRPGQSIATESTPVEAAPEQGQHDRLLDYGTYWLYLPRGEQLMYQYEKVSGSLKRIADLNGNALEMRHGADGRLQGVIDAAGRTLALQYDAQGRCIGLSLPDGRSASYGYDANGRLVTARDPAGIETTYKYDSDGDVTAISVGNDRRSTFFAYTQTAPKRIRSVTDAAGHTRQYDADQDDPGKVRLTDGEGQVWIYRSQQGRTAEIIDPLGQAIRYRYDDGNLVSVQDRANSIRQMAYDWRGNLTQQVDPLGNVTAYTYDAYERLTSSCDGLGATWRYSYDARGNPISIESPTGAVTRLEYDEAGLASAATDANGETTRFQYDLHGNMCAIVAPDGQTTRLEYDAQGLQLTGIVDPEGHKTGYAHDGNGRLLTVTHPDGTTLEHRYDCCAGLASTDENGHQVMWARDEISAIVALVDGEGHTAARFDYDRNGRPAAMYGPQERALNWEYDAAGRVRRVVDALGVAVQTARDGEGRLAGLTDGLGRTSRLAYDGNGNLVRMTDPAGQEVSYRYDAAGRATERRNARGQQITVAYAPNGQILNRAFDGVTQADLEYDPFGSLTLMRDELGETRFQYDSCHRLVEITYPRGLSVHYEWDAAGRLTSLTYPTGLCVSYRYDTRGRLTRIAWGDEACDISCDGVGNITGIQRTNGVHSRFLYDGNREILALEHHRSGEALARLEYERDAAGNILSISGLWPLAPLPPRVPHEARFNDLDQITHDNDMRYQYDPDGNLVQIGEQVWQAEYDADNRLTWCRRAGEEVRYRYDGLGRCSGRVCEGDQRVWYRDLASRLLCEGRAADEVGTCYIYAGPALVARVTGSSETHFYHYDRLGNTLMLTDSEGGVVAAYAYGPHGEPVAQAGEGTDNPFTFVGQYGVMDEGDGLYLMATRRYDAHTGRFVQRDRIGLAGGLNLYAYVQNSPTVEVDPDGEFVVFLAAALTVAAVAAAGIAIADRLNRGVINRGIQLGAQSAANPGSVTVDVVHQRLGPNPGAQAVREIKEAVIEGGVTVVTNAPTPFMVPAKGVKAIYHVTQGDGKSAIKEGIGLVPGPVGEVGDMIQNAHTVSEVPLPSPDCAPAGGR